MERKNSYRVSFCMLIFVSMFLFVCCQSSRHIIKDLSTHRLENCTYQLDEFYKLSDCDKLNLLLDMDRNEIPINNQCLDSIVGYFTDKTRILQSGYWGFAGLLYPNDSMYHADLKKWKVYFKCDKKDDQRKFR